MDPDYQGKGIGGALIAETKKLAAEAGYAGIVILLPKQRWNNTMSMTAVHGPKRLSVSASTRCGAERILSVCCWRKRGEALGFAMGNMEQYDGCAAYDLIEIVIAHAHQRKGLGTAFLRELEKRVKKMGAALVQLSAVNDRMHEVFYGKLQYKDADSLKIKTKWLR